MVSPAMLPAAAWPLIIDGVGITGVLIAIGSTMGAGVIAAAAAVFASSS